MKKTIIKTSNGVESEFQIDSDKRIFEMSLETGLVLLAQTEEQKDGKIKIVEKPMHLYLPAKNKQSAVNQFNNILGSVKKRKK